jgi:hypothetical protein
VAAIVLKRAKDFSSESALKAYGSEYSLELLP